MFILMINIFYIRWYIKVLEKWKESGFRKVWVRELGKAVKVSVTFVKCNSKNPMLFAICIFNFCLSLRNPV